jgi:hypothetical protein
MGVKVFLYDPPPYYIIERAKREDASFTSRCAADTMPQSILLLAAEYPAPSPSLFTTTKQQIDEKIYDTKIRIR